MSLFIFLESGDDLRFFSRIIVPLLKTQYNDVQPIPYAEDQTRETRKYLRALESQGYPYIFTIDLDPSDCLVNRREKTASKYEIDPERILIVCKEIESWYLSGLKQCDCRKLGIKYYAMTDNICKESFERMTPKEPKIILFNKILDSFDIETGKEKNFSLRYFMRKWVQ